MVKIDSGIFYNIHSNLFKIEQFNLNVENMYQYSYSPDKNIFIYSVIEEGDEPELFMSGRGKLTDNDEMEMYPSVNQLKDFVYCTFGNSVSASKVILNGDKVLPGPNPKGLYKYSVIDSLNIIAVYEQLYDKQHYLVIWRLSNVNTYKLIPVQFIVQQIVSLNTNEFLLQAYREGIYDVYIYNAINNSISNLTNNSIGKFSYIDAEKSIKTIDIERIFSLDFPIYYWFSQFICVPFAYGNDFLGRLSWNCSYVLEAFINIYEKTKDYRYKILINRAVKDVLLNRNRFIYADLDKKAGNLWCSKKYSNDGITPINLLVNNAKILYPLLRAYRLDIIEPHVKNEIDNVFNDLWDYNEEDWDGHYYHFKYGIQYEFDGVWLPFNQCNAWGLCLLEYLKMNSNAKVKKRVFEIANFLKKEFCYTEDGRILWHYWPSEFYKGWTTEQNISLNTPFKIAMKDELYEDISHGGITALFISEFYNFYPNEIFTLSDLEKIRHSFNHFYSVNSRFISGDVNYTAGDKVRFYPYYGWQSFSSQQSVLDGKKFLPSIYPDFETGEALYFWSLYVK